jgi:hypothetical protein
MSRVYIWCTCFRVVHAVHMSGTMLGSAGMVLPLAARGAAGLNQRSQQQLIVWLGFGFPELGML